MLKSFFIFLFSISIAFANTNIDKGDISFAKQNYIDAIKHYKKAYNSGHKKARMKLIMTYIKLGDNFNRIKDYDRSKNYYKKALDLKSALAKQKISKIYEKEGDLLYKIKKYKLAQEYYENSLKLGNTKVQKKLKNINKKIAHEKSLKNDTRKLVTNKSPKWTKAIGRLITPTKLTIKKNNRYTTKQKKCSATLVNFNNYSKSRIIITASHCLTGYDKDAGDMRFIIRTKKGEMIQRFASVYIDSKYNGKKLKTTSDYAILILSGSIKRSQVDPMIITSKSYLKLKNEHNYNFGSLAGFSSDVGDYGAKLTFDPKCELNYFSKTYGKSRCAGFKGASGGPVVLSVSNDKKRYKSYFVGVVSHFRNNQYKKIFFAPHHIIYKDIKRAINKYNK